MICKRGGEWGNPLESNRLPDDIGVKILRHRAIDYQVAGGRSRLVVRIRQG